MGGWTGAGSSVVGHAATNTLRSVHNPINHLDSQAWGGICANTCNRLFTLEQPSFHWLVFSSFFSYLPQSLPVHSYSSFEAFSCFFYKTVD